jgi:SPP1 family predicted phage head-tail adaptor
VWALIEPLSEREALQAAQKTAVLSTAVTIVYRADISVKNRVRIGARVLQVESYQDLDGKKDELRMLCSEAQA